MKTKIIILLMAVISLNACNDIFEITPQDRISESDVWSDQSLIRLYVKGTYAKTFKHGFFRYEQIGHATDELHSIKGAVSFKLFVQGDINADNISESRLTYLNNWKNSYLNIRDVNIFMDKIDQAPIEENEKQEMIGEMRFIRAYIYANLIWRYGGVPIIEKVFGIDDDNYSVTRSSYDDCVSYIVDELDESINLLPDQQPANKLGRVSADAARALKSRVLLYAASPLNNPANDLTKWQKAADAAEVLIETRYLLHDDYQDLFLKYNEEIIFARYHSQANPITNADNHNFSLSVGRNGDRGWGSDSPTQNLVDAYEMDNGEFPLLSEGTVNPASGYDPNNPYVNRDPRFYASILYDGSMWMGRETETFTGGLDSPQSPIDAHNATKSGYYLKKFVPEGIPPSGSSVNATSPWIIFRYGEILLNYAEAKYMLGDEETALKYLNEIRYRESVQMPDVDATGDELLNRIQHERRVELVFEHHRFFDIRRWMIADVVGAKNIRGIMITKDPNTGVKTYDYSHVDKNLINSVWHDRLYRLPIPRAEIDRSNGSLTQNPGYN